MTTTRVEVIGIDHIYLAVRDFGVPEAFYDRVRCGRGRGKRCYPGRGEDGVVESPVRHRNCAG